MVLQLLPLLVGVVQKRRYDGDPAIDRPPSKAEPANIREGGNPLSSDLLTPPP